MLFVSSDKRCSFIFFHSIHFCFSILYINTYTRYVCWQQMLPNRYQNEENVYLQPLLFSSPLRRNRKLKFYRRYLSFLSISQLFYFKKMFYNQYGGWNRLIIEIIIEPFKRHKYFKRFHVLRKSSEFQSYTRGWWITSHQCYTKVGLFFVETNMTEPTLNSLQNML